MNGIDMKSYGVEIVVESMELAIEGLFIVSK